MMLKKDTKEIKEHAYYGLFTCRTYGALFTGIFVIINIMLLTEQNQSLREAICLKNIT